MKKDTVILIPSYEPDEKLLNVVSSLLELEYPVLVINDGSGEKYDYIFDQIKDKVTYLVHPQNKGKGVALKHGFSYLTFDDLGCKYVITCDGDGQHATEDIVKVDKRLHEVNEVVFGVRDFGKDVPRRSKVGNNMSRFARTYITKDYIQDDQCGLRGFPFSYLDELISTTGGRYEYEMNVVCSLQMRRMPIYEVPIQTIYLDGNKSSHFHRGGDTFRIQRVIWNYCIYGLLAFFLTLGFFYAIDAINYYLLDSVMPFMYKIWMVLGFQFAANIAITSILIPTKKMGKRLFLEGMFTLTRSIFICLWVWLFYVISSNFFTSHPAFEAPVEVILAFFLSSFVNFFLAYFIHKIKYTKIKRRS